MITFKSFVAEAEFSEDNFARLITAVEKRMPKLLGSRIYRYGGPEGTEQLPGATGYLYFYGNHQAFRVRASSGTVLGFDIWTEYHPNKGPAYTADTASLNAATILGAMKEIANIIKNPSVGDLEVPLSESLQLDEMAKRAGPEQFYSMMKDAYGEDGAKSVTWEQIKKVADDNDVLIPAYIRGQKTGRGKWDSTYGDIENGAPVDTAGSIEPPDEGDAGKDQPIGDDPSTEQNPKPAADEPVAPGTAVATVEPKAPPKEKKAPILYIKVTAQDPDSKRFISAADNAAAQKLYAQLSSAVAGPAAEADAKDPDTLYGHMAQLVQMACKGSLRSLLIYGGPGTGKTFTIMKTVKEQGLQPGVDYVKLSGKASAIEIYKTLFMYRKNGLVIFDDLDSMWRNEDATNILKAALDTSPVREISWVSNQTINVSRMDDARKETLFAKIDRQLNGEPEPGAETTEADDENDDDFEPDLNGGIVRKPVNKLRKGKKEEPTEVDPTKIKYPSTFDFTGRVVFISNLKKDQFDSAIMSRSAKINMDLTPQQILMRMKQILPSLGGNDVSIEKKEELLDELLKMNQRGEITQVTMREFTKGLDIVRSGVPNWRELVIYA